MKKMLFPLIACTFISLMGMEKKKQVIPISYSLPQPLELSNVNAPPFNPPPPYAPPAPSAPAGSTLVTTEIHIQNTAHNPDHTLQPPHAPPTHSALPGSMLVNTEIQRQNTPHNPGNTHHTFQPPAQNQQYANCYTVSKALCKLAIAGCCIPAAAALDCLLIPIIGYFNQFEYGPDPFGMDYDSPEPPDCYLCIGQCPCTKGILNFACNCNYETFVDCDYFNNENASKKDKSEDIEYVRNLYHSPEFRNFPRDKQFAIELYLGTRGEELRMSPEQESQLDPTILAKFHGDLPL